MDCVFSVSDRDCREPVCLDPSPRESVELLNELGTCLGERCWGLEEEEYARCQATECGVELLLCVADSYPDACWGLEACILAECGREAAQECYDRCLEEASEGCQVCREEVEFAFLREHCAPQLLTLERCTTLHECMDTECVKARCRRALEAVWACGDDARAADPEDYRERLGPCYPSPG